MGQRELAVKVDDLFFYYATPVKRPLIEGLPFKTVKFERKIALDHVGLEVPKGRITALMGRNGSGKTTLIKVITGARFAQSGSVQVFGESPGKVKSRIGICLGSTLIYNRLSGRENLEYFGRLYNVQDVGARIRELTAILSLEKVLDNLVESYSFGMKAKLSLARAMIHSPDLLILDEPTLGIDFQIAQQIRAFIRELNCSVLLTTHYMEEAEMLANDLAIIHDGKMLFQGTKEKVLGELGANSLAQAYTTAVERAEVSV